ncbi:uncharacterized protein LOC110969854 [Acanthochromis polyacanthus]|uniref:uncharacterized protein LOC110969854 n=1 Tax=Acanthochromis polyacanthus TaxID=80966 RepID=UPI000B8F94B1|nr:uncharacterized protein LOC110969854 [Acanthochromis polyacanthus]
MGQKLMGHTGAVCGDAVVDMSPDKSVLILLKHCQDMKQQETRLRFITLFLLLGCTALFIFTICADLRQHGSSGFSGQGNPAEHSLAYSKQECSHTKAAQNEFQSVRNDLRSVFENNVDNKTYMKWQPVIGENYSEKERAIVIPVTGFYFVYAHFALRCHDKDEGFKRFSVQLHRRPFGYNDNVSLTDFRDAIKCSSEPYRNIFVGQLFELEREDQVKVWLREGYKLIASSSFGIFRI